jgi:beta-lactam-binding protein with PASTA domain
MNKFLLYLRTDTFRKNLLIAVGSVLAFLIIAYFTLDIYTRHGESMPVPKLIGMQAEKAIEILDSNGFSYSVDTIYQADQPPGMVVQQDPDPNTNVKKGRTIYLTVITRTAPNVGFPDIVDKTFVEVQSILNAAGLKVGDTVYAPDIARDRVLDAKIAGQSLQQGETVPKGSRISLILGDGKGNSTVDVPDLTGLTLSDAAFALKGASLAIGNKFWQGTVKDSANAVIIMQIPAASDTTKVPTGSKIDITLSSDGK